MRRTLAKFGLPFEKATPLVHFPKALKRPRINAPPARISLLIMKEIGLLIMKRIAFLIMEEIVLLIMEGIGLCFRSVNLIFFFLRQDPLGGGVVALLLFIFYSTLFHFVGFSYRL